MARPSKLNDDQWLDIKKRLLGGEKAADLAREFGISKTAISTRVSKRVEAVKSIANQALAMESALVAMPVSEQILAVNLIGDLRSISTHLAGAGKFGAATAHRLAGIVNDQVSKVDDAEPLKSVSTLHGIAALTKLANEASQIGLNLLNANKDAVKEANQAERDVPSGLSHFYGDA
jgi:Helix-turn-helix domain of resolvase